MWPSHHTNDEPPNKYEAEKARGKKQSAWKVEGKEGGREGGSGRWRERIAVYDGGSGREVCLEWREGWGEEAQVGKTVGNQARNFCVPFYFHLFMKQLFFKILRHGACWVFQRKTCRGVEGGREAVRGKE